MAQQLSDDNQHFPTREDIKSALAVIQHQIDSRFPTREDIKTASDAIQDQLDRRFNAAAEVSSCQIHERDKRLECELDERDKRIDTELSERDKAVEVLAKNLRENIDRGDDALRSHITTQIQQIQLALESADKLELTRIASMEAKIAGLNREILLITDASEKAITKADAATEKRFESVNEFRAQMADQAVKFIPRTESLALIDALSDKISTITDRINRSEGRGAGMGQIWGIVVAGVGALVGIIAIFTWISTMNPKVRENSEFRSRQEIIRDFQAAQNNNAQQQPQAAQPRSTP